MEGHMLSIGKSCEIKVILYKMKINCISQSLVPSTWYMGVVYAGNPPAIIPAPG